MAEKVTEDQSIEKKKQGVSRMAGCSAVIGKGLAEKNSHALFVNFDGWEKMTGKEKRKTFKDMDILMTGFAGLKGSAILAREKYEILLSRYPASFLDRAKRQEELSWQIPEAAPAGKSGDCNTFFFPDESVKAMYLLSEGGVFAGIWDMGKLAGVGLKIYCKNIPVKQETIEICNFFDVNPYQMFSEGSCLILAKSGYRFKERLLELGIFSEVIGFTTENNDRVVINGEEQRYLEKHYEDALALAMNGERTLQDMK